jgi:hypothetical protein
MLGGMGLRLLQLNFKARDDAALGRFWGEALGWVVAGQGRGATSVQPAGFVWREPVGVGIDVIAVPDPETVKYHLRGPSGGAGRAPA